MLVYVCKCSVILVLCNVSEVKRNEAYLIDTVHMHIIVHIFIHLYQMICRGHKLYIWKQIELVMFFQGSEIKICVKISDMSFWS